jgi:ADP-ribose pyrophosphatase YjhB (NUDIX family)
MQTKKTESQFDRREFAAVAVVLYRGRILAVTRKNLPGDWALPGGKRNPTESLRRCAWRELEEETGIVAHEESMTPVFNGWDSHGNEVTAFLAGSWAGIARSREEGVEVAWLEPALLLDPSYTFHEFNREVLDAVDRLGRP